MAAPGATGESRLHAWLRRRAGWTLLLMTALFMVFGALSVDLARLAWANARFMAEHGWQAVLDDALWQLAELFLKALLAMLAYLMFKLCEHALVQRLAQRPSPTLPQERDDEDPSNANR